VYKPEYPGLYYFDTFTFTTLGTSGNRGPDPTKGYANPPWRDGDFSIVDGQQQWTVPATGTYTIVAAGAYGVTPGRVVSGDIDLYEGQTLTMLVGQQPTPLTANVADNVTVGGGGGTFVVSDGKPLIVASGGDGGVYSTGYVSTDISIPNTVQPYISMSADGNRFVSIDYNFLTPAAQISVYKYQSNKWNLETSFTFLGFYPIKMSGDGNTVTVTSGPDIYVYRYTTLWSLNTVLSIPFLSSLSMNYDATKLVCAFAGGFGYIFQRTGDTWSSPIEFSSGWNNEIGVAISGDGNTICIGSNGTNPPKIYDGSGNFIANLPSYDPMNQEGATNFSISYDGSVIAAHTTPLHVVPPTGFVRVFVNLVLSYQITFESSDYSSKYIQLSYDGTKLLVGDNSYVRLYTDSTTYTSISTSTSPIDIVGTSMNSSGSSIINALVSLSAPQTFVYNLNSGGVPGEFVPSGTGNGVSGSGFYGDGEQTDPFFGFLKPKAYVNGGFGNSYEYGQPGVPKEGGFGGGQSPLNLLTGLTNITGYKQVRPSIPLLSGQTVGSMALSEDGNTFLVTYIPYDHVGEGVNVYSYVDSSWVSSQLYSDVTWKPSVSISVDGSVWLIGGDVWRNGSFETQLTSQEQVYTGSSSPQQIRKSVVSGNGNVCTVLTTTSAWNIYVYSSGTWSLSSSFQTPGMRTKNDCALSFDGHTFVVMNQYTTSTNIIEVKLYRYVSDIWTEELIYFNLGGTAITNTVTMNRDGSIIFFNTLYNGYKYSDGTLTSVPPDTVSTAVFSRTNPNLYAYANAVNVYAPEISLDVIVNINPGNFLLSFGTNVLAVCDSVQTGNKAIVFVDMYDPTTTCTATTSIDHGYPRKYEVQITGTNSFNGTWLITAGSSNTFTFQAFGGPTETTGYVSGTTTGISGGGGYTGSAGDGVSSATCYADESVVNFTDLGAKSNTAGTVTISLIDPRPLKQTWTWDQTYTNTAPKTALQVVNWSDKLGKFQSINGSSTDGIHWDGYTFFEVLNAGSSDFPFYTAYSDTLNLYIGMRLGGGITFIYITSNDGIVWTDTVTEGLNLDQTNVMYNSSPFVWAPELGLFVYVSNTIISTSYDGIIWTERYYDPTFNEARSIAYSPSIHTFVCTASWSSSSDTGVYSTDGLTWNTWMVVTYPVIEGQIVIASGDSVTWSPKLNIFVASVTFLTENQLYSNAYIARSTDGQTWTTDGFNIPNDPGIYGWQILWSEELNIFSAISIAGNFINTTIHSYDGINWSFITTSGVTGQLAYSPSLQLFLVSDENGFRQFISIEGIYYVDIAGYYPPPSRPSCTWGSQIGKFIKQNSEAGSVSSDGIHWEKSIITKDDTPAWSPELGLFVALTFDSPIVFVGLAYYSYDGKTWTETSFNIPSFPPPPPNIDPFLAPGRLPYVAWSPTLGVFSGAFYSRDGINWSPSLVGCTAIGWSSFHGMFVAFYYTYVYYSYDGTTWSTGNNTTEFNGNGIIACSSFGRFVCEASTNFLEEITPQGVLYSDDGINWISPGVAFPFSGPIWAEELSIFVASSYNTYTGSDNDTGWVSSDGISWSQLDFQIGSWSPELGLFLCPGGYSPVSKTF